MNLDAQIVAGIATAVLTLTLTATTVFRSVLEEVGKLLVRKLQRKSRDFSNGLESLAKFYSIFEQIRELKYVDRVSLFEGRNGGGIPKAGSVFTIRSIFGWSNRDVHPEDKYDALFKVDSHYISMLRDVIDKGVVTLNVDELPKGSMLHAFYREEGVVCSQIFFVQLDDASNSLIYASIASYTKPFDEIQMNRLSLLIQQIRGLVS